MANHKIVVAQVPQEAQQAVTTALAETLNIQVEVAAQIAGAAPIVILSELDPDQAQAIIDALLPVKQAGAQLVISAAESTSMPQINWPAPPTVAGRELETYAPGYTPPAPPPQPAPAAAPAAPQAPAVPPGVFVCPHCGNYIQAVAAAAPSPASSGSGIRQVPVPPGLADPSSSGGMPPAVGALPEVPNVPPAARMPERPPSSSATRAGPMDLEEFERGIGGGKPPSASADALLRQLDASLPAKDPGLRALEGGAEEEPQAPAPRPAPKQPSQRKRTTPSPKGSIRDRRFRDRRR